jgi:hypothetical protein
MTLKTAALISLVAFAPMSAHAILLADLESPNKYLTSTPGAGQVSSATVTHSLYPAIPNLYQATSGLLVLAFADDADRAQNEWAQITIGLDGLFSHEVGGSASSILTYDWELFGLSAHALFDLNADGLLGVTVAATNGDFWWKQSLLTVDARPVSVPEPGTLLLLGSGLLAIGFRSRRRAQA